MTVTAYTATAMSRERCRAANWTERTAPNVHEALQSASEQRHLPRRSRSASFTTVTKAHFVVPLADIERGPKEATWPLTTEWLRLALAETDATPRGDGELHVQLEKNGRQVMVRGRLRAELSMPCVRTLEPVDVDLSPDIFLLLSPAPAAPNPTKGTPAKTRGKTPEADKRKKTGWADDPELSTEQAAVDTFEGDKVELDRFIREFILLELPMMPMQKGLHDEPEPAIARGPVDADEGGEPTIDPRLAPLAKIASRLREKKE